MYVVTGATGHVGGAVLRALLGRGERVTAVIRDGGKRSELEALGADVAVADVLDVDAMAAVLGRGRRAFILNPPAPPDTDTDAVETRTADALVAAVSAARPERVIVESTYGARPGERVGDLTVLHRLEVGLAVLPLQLGALRAAYYFSNWDAQLETARREGVLQSLFPAEFQLPMAAPDDLGAVGARLLTQEAAPPRVTFVEGPERYSAADVAAVLGQALGRTVRVEVTPREGWVAAFEAQGFSHRAAEAYAAMAAATLDGDFPDLGEVERGPTTLASYLAERVRATQA